MTVLFVHIMKTAGTSLRRMMLDSVGPASVYPNEQDLDQLPNRWYPGPTHIARAVNDRETHDARVIIGHVPFVLAEAFDEPPLTVAVLRNPIDRAISMLRHKQRQVGERPPRFERILRNDAYVAGQIADYQSKIFAYDSIAECPDHVNGPLEIDDDRMGRALKRLSEVDVLGTVDDMAGFVMRFEQATGIALGEPRHDNAAPAERPEVSAEVTERLVSLTARDRVLYDHAKSLTGR